MAPRETANNAYAKFWDDKQKVLWCVVVFSGVVNCSHQRFTRVMWACNLLPISLRNGSRAGGVTCFSQFFFVLFRPT